MKVPIKKLHHFKIKQELFTENTKQTFKHVQNEQGILVTPVVILLMFLLRVL
jgi:hypothetical protein